MQTNNKTLSGQRLIGWAALALGAHALALSGMQWGWVPPASLRLPASWMQLRTLPVPPPPAVAVDVRDEPKPSLPLPPSLPSRTEIQRKPVAVPEVSTPMMIPQAQHVEDGASSSALPESAAEPQLDPDPPSSTPDDPGLRALPPPAPGSATAAPTDEDGIVIPSYRTQIPQAMLLRYEMQRGALYGTGDLEWRPTAGHYELKFEGRVAGLMVITQKSSGGFDEAGLAPVRFTDQRIRRSLTAANFQRRAGKITYSQPQTEHELRPGTQDRLSWMVQLAAIAAAESSVLAPGGKVVMFVTGTQGDAGVWVFRCQGTEQVRTGLGEVTAIKFKREPREAFDTSVEVWLDPQRQYLPVRALQRSGESEKGFDLRLKSLGGNDVSPSEVQ